MAKTDKADMSCARVKQYTASDVSKAERHNERKNETYENMNVIAERIPFNVHFKKPTAPTYMEQLKQMETDGQVSLRGLRKDATLFDEIVIDVNTMYFERNGGYEYVKRADQYAKGVDAAEEVLPGIKNDLLLGKFKPRETDVAAVARASTEERREKAEQLRVIPEKKPKADKESARSGTKRQQEVYATIDKSYEDNMAAVIRVR